MFEGPRLLYSGEEKAKESITLMEAYNNPKNNYRDNTDQHFSVGADVVQ